MLVEGAQTFESLKDLVVLVTIVLFGYPALIAVPPAYMLSDLIIEGVLPEFVLSWAEGYFFWTAFVWMAYQLIGRNPDFRLAQTWRRYALFVGLIMLLDPVMWGFICSGSKSSRRRFRIGPSRRRCSSRWPSPGWWRQSPFWSLCHSPAGSDGSGRRTRTRQRTHARESRLDLGVRRRRSPGWPARFRPACRSAIFLFTPFIALLLVMVGVTAVVALRSANDDAVSLATRLHVEAADNIKVRLDTYLSQATASSDAERKQGLVSLLRSEDLYSDSNGPRLHPRQDLRNSRVVGARWRDAVVRSAVGALEGAHERRVSRHRRDRVPFRPRHGKAAITGNMADLRHRVP